MIVMNGPFLILYHPLVTFGGLNAYWPMLAFRAVAWFAVIRALRYVISARLHLRTSDIFWHTAALCAFAGLIVFSFDSTLVRRTSFGQPHQLDVTGGTCEMLEKSFGGAFNRSRYVCASSIDASRDVYRLCPEKPSSPVVTAMNRDDWYNLCGTKMSTDFQFSVSIAAVELFILAVVLRGMGRDKVRTS